MNIPNTQLHAFLQIWCVSQECSFVVNTRIARYDCIYYMKCYLWKGNVILYMKISLALVNIFLDIFYVIMRHFIQEYTFFSFIKNSNNVKIHIFFKMFNGTQAYELLLLAHALLSKCFVTDELLVNSDLPHE